MNYEFFEAKVMNYEIGDLAKNVDLTLKPGKLVLFIFSANIQMNYFAFETKMRDYICGLFKAQLGQ